MDRLCAPWRWHGGSPDAFSFGEHASRAAPSTSRPAAVLGALTSTSRLGADRDDTAAELLIFMDIVQEGSTSRSTLGWRGSSSRRADRGPGRPIHSRSRRRRSRGRRRDGTGTRRRPTRAARLRDQRAGIVIAPGSTNELTTARCRGRRRGHGVVCAPSADTSARWRSHQCACDQESDGKPGATLLAQRAAVELDESTSPCHAFSLSGEVHSSDIWC